MSWRPNEYEKDEIIVGAQYIALFFCFGITQVSYTEGKVLKEIQFQVLLEKFQEHSQLSDLVLFDESCNSDVSLAFMFALLAASIREHWKCPVF